MDILIICGAALGSVVIGYVWISILEWWDARSW